MKSRMIKGTAIALSATLLCGTAAFALTGGQKNQEKEPQSIAQTKEEKELIRDETVYVLSGADGTVQKLMISDWLQNEMGVDSYTMKEEGNAVWDAEGSKKEIPVQIAISYKLDGAPITPEELAGKSGKVTIRFDYTNTQYQMVKVNGKNEKIYVPYAMLTGLLLDNEVFSNVTVSNGKLVNDGDRTAVVGIALPGMQESLGLDKEKLELPNYVEITADAKNFELGMTVTVATSEIFKQLDEKRLDSFGSLDESLTQITDAMEQLLDGSDALHEGLCTLLEKSDELVKGINQLASGAKALSDGAGTLDAGASQLQAGAAQLQAGLNTLNANSGSLNQGAQQVFHSLLSNAATQMTAAGLSVPSMTISNYAEVLNGVIASLDETAVYNQALAQVKAAVEAKRDYIASQVKTAAEQEVAAQVTAAVQGEITAKVTAAVREEIAPKVTAQVQEAVRAQVILEATGMDKAAYEAAVAAGAVDAETQSAVEAAIAEALASEGVQQTIAAEIEAQLASESVQGLIAAQVEAQMGAEEVQSLISSTIAEKMQSEEIQTLIAQNIELQVEKAIAEAMSSPEVQGQLTAASEGAKAVISLKASLDSYNAFYLGLRSYTAGVAEAAAGANTLKNGVDALKRGTSELKSGAATLYSGTSALKNGAPALIDGITQLKDGSKELADGLAEFNEKAIQKLVDAVDGDLEGLTQRIRAMIDLSRTEKTFTSPEESVKYIIKTEEIG